jgi:spore maturation protein CgeB
MTAIRSKWAGIYNAAQITFNCSLNGDRNMRIFEVMAAGGFLVTDRRRTNNLVTAITQHASSGSEANQVIQNFNQLSQTNQQALVNFLRSL